MILPLELHVAVQLISNLLQALGKFFMLWINQLSSTQLSHGHDRVVVAMSLHSFINETTHGQEQSVKETSEQFHCDRTMSTTHFFSKTVPTSKIWSFPGKQSQVFD